MKQSPREKKIQELMQPGRLTLDGMLGHDHRTLSEIIDDDQSAINKLSITHADIAQRLREISAAGRRGLGTAVTVEDRYQVIVDEARGALPCPFGDQGACPKRITHLTHLRTGETLHWTALSIHMIEAHGFCEGHGARFRIDPVRAARILAIPPRCSV